MKLTKYVEYLQILTDRIPLIKPILRPFNRIYYKYIDKTKINKLTQLNAAFKEYGMDVLKIFDETMKKSGYKYSLAFGTMLGAVREQGFIKHDFDIDVFMWIEDWNIDLATILKSAGFTYKHTFLVDNGKLAREDTIELNGVQIDIFYLYPALEGRKYSYCCDFFPYENCRSYEQSIRKYGGLLPRRLEMPTTKELINVQFGNLSLPILSNANEFLSFRYGTDYLTPNPRWQNGDNQYIIRWTEKLAQLIDY